MNLSIRGEQEMLTMMAPRREEASMARTADVVLQTQLVAMALLPTVGCEAEIQAQQRDLMSAYGVVVHDLRTIVLELAQIESKEIRIGRFSLDMEHDVAGMRRHTKTEGHFYGVVDGAGQVSITYVGSHGYEMRWTSPNAPTLH
jgi:hypothetical protein